LVKLHDGTVGSVTVGGAVSPAGGNFEEPVTQATLKVVGAFHGLSRDRSDARKYPAIDPLESWSKYKSFIDDKEIDTAQGILKKAHEVSQMTKVVGEEGVSIHDFILYLKGKFLDAVYLQQNAFDEVDAATIDERQKYVFHVIHEILETTFNFDSKDSARKFFQNLIQQFIEWNSIKWKSKPFFEKEKCIRSTIA